jgi:hypothetical protein
MFAGQLERAHVNAWRVGIAKLIAAANARPDSAGDRRATMRSASCA